MRASSNFLLLVSWLETIILSLATGNNMNNGSVNDGFDENSGMTIYFCMAPITVTAKDQLQVVYNWKVNATGLVRQSIAVKPTSFFEVLNMRLEFDSGPDYSVDFTAKYLAIAQHDRWYQIVVGTYQVKGKNLFEQDSWGIDVAVDGRDFEHPTKPPRRLRDHILTSLVLSARGASSWAPGGYAVLCNTEWSAFAILGTIILSVFFGCIFLCIKKCRGATQ